MFIITAEPNGSDEKRALYYGQFIGKRRIVRQSYGNPYQKGLKLLSYKVRRNAQAVCDRTNELHNDNFKVEKID